MREVREERSPAGEPAEFRAAAGDPVVAELEEGPSIDGAERSIAALAAVVKPARERAAADPIASADQDWQVRLRGGVDLAPDIVSRRLTAEARRPVDRVAGASQPPRLPQF